jgi:hypothetical protein
MLYEARRVLIYSIWRAILFVFHSRIFRARGETSWGG